MKAREPAPGQQIIIDEHDQVFVTRRPAGDAQPGSAVVKAHERGIPAPPVHPLSALATMMLDAVWGVVDFTGFAIPLMSLVTGALCFASVLAVQRAVAKDSWGAAFARALVLAVLAGVPFMVMGTAAGAVLLGWAGLRGLSRLGDGR